MNEKDYSEEQKQLPSLGAAFFFSNKFGNSQFEYGFNRWGVCRYPLDENGNRIADDVDPHVLCVYGDMIYRSETVAIITSNKGDTPNSLYFKINPEIADIYSEHFFDSSSKHINVFIDRFNQHLDMLNKPHITVNFQKPQQSAFYVNFKFKYDHVLKEVSAIAIVGFSQKDSKLIHYYVTNNDLITQATMRKLDIEFFNRYYKHKIEEAMPKIAAGDLHALIDIDSWSESLKSLVKISYY